ncbi:hypothetical protein QVD17_19705 [Tagetes erecta]|uniref:Uncharacterized protein n=1 Tax=Tagetes erecta TaxID=13708 RepID=A0AAD8KNI5_TARER|nr:hypothetical protein QVD17_19705 [Tagetes erecta]
MPFLILKPRGGGRAVWRLLGCKVFNQFSNDGEILKVTNFDSMEQYYLNDSLWNLNGLLTKCANVGNQGAHQIIQQIPFLLLDMEHIIAS